MGFDLTAMNACAILHRKMGALGSVLTLGRQEVHLDMNELVEFGLSSPNSSHKFCEPVLRELFGAREVASLDASDFEGADYIHDLNSEEGIASVGTFDVIADFGTLEHVFDVRTSFENATQLAKVGGNLVHILPANQFCGHGFYQFSPEFFFSYYREDRGFSVPRVFIVPLGSPRYWYELPKPQKGQRLNITSRGPVYIVCFVSRLAEIFAYPIQQTDYESTWRSEVHPRMEPELKTPRRWNESLNNHRISAIATVAFQRAFRLCAGILYPVRADLPLHRIQPKDVAL